MDRDIQICLQVVLSVELLLAVYWRTPSRRSVSELDEIKLRNSSNKNNQSEPLSNKDQPKNYGASKLFFYQLIYALSQQVTVVKRYRLEDVLTIYYCELYSSFRPQTSGFQCSLTFIALTLK